MASNYYKDVVDEYKNLKKDEVIMPVAKDEDYKTLDDYELTSWSEWNKYAEESYAPLANDAVDKAYVDATAEQKMEDKWPAPPYEMGSGYFIKPAIHYTKSRHADTGKEIDWIAEGQKVHQKLVELGAVPEVKAEAQALADSAYAALRSEAPEKKVRKPRYPRYKKDDRVNTPNGPGNVWLVDSDGTVCVELDSDPSILHEFERKELKKIK